MQIMEAEGGLEEEVPVAKRVCLEDSSSHQGSRAEKKEEGDEGTVEEPAPAQAEAPKVVLSSTNLNIRRRVGGGVGGIPIAETTLWVILEHVIFECVIFTVRLLQ